MRRAVVALFAIAPIAMATSGCSPDEPAASCATLRADDPPLLTVSHMLGADAAHHVDDALRCVRDAERDAAQKYLLGPPCGMPTLVSSTIDGARATVRMRCTADRDPLPFALVRERDAWKIDVAETRRLSLELFESNLRAHGIDDAGIATARGFMTEPPPRRDAPSD